MLISTFQHLRGIGAKKERNFWRSGILSWNDLMLKQKSQLSIFEDDKGDSDFLESLAALKNEDIDFFTKRLAQKEHYRIALSFPAKTLFLDIETTGLSKYYDVITLIGWSTGSHYGVWIMGDSDADLRAALSEAKAIITFNGSLFDLPFLRQEFKCIQIPSAHIDLRFFGRRVGLSGGQKAIEKYIGIAREKKLLGLDGETAPLLWHKYRLGDLEALKLLVTYNHADIEGMKQIFDFIVKQLQEQEELPISTSYNLDFSTYLSEIKWFTSSSNGGNNSIKLHPYKGSTSPSMFLKNLIPSCQLSSLRVVGIDLSGSSKRPSGWCFLNGNQASTRQICTDADIIYATLDTNPCLVSIDSPLSLPIGRISVFDDDPGREDFGIIRYCERILKKRGINVYPSLIRSMQTLTARGIRLANHFRQLGIPVIESYPGAAQDIMNIPRKRASLEFLQRGLAEFGIEGNFLEHSVTHDELDAITSGIVGLFFLSGHYEALGNEQEGSLIIPKIGTSTSRTSENKCKIVGISGLISSGKTTTGRLLESSGFHYGRFSLVLMNILHERGIEPSRETLQKVGEEVNKNPGQRWLCQELVRRLPTSGNLVIDGLRFPVDHAFLVETFGLDFMHIHIRSSKKNRLERYVSKGGSYQEFANADSHPVEASATELANLAHIVIDNDGDLESFLSEVKQIISCQQIFKGEAIACL